jgi:hypothetical protein
MKRGILLCALLLATGAVLAWLGLGANRGWTRTSVEVRTIDEVTGIEGIQYEDKFVPGVEVLGGALLCAGVLASSSLLIRSK